MAYTSGSKEGQLSSVIQTLELCIGESIDNECSCFSANILFNLLQTLVYCKTELVLKTLQILLQSGSFVHWLRDITVSVSRHNEL